MPLVDLLHLSVIVAGLVIALWSLIALRKSIPQGRFAVFGLASAGAVFGCAALGGEVGVLPPEIWFLIVMAVMLWGAAMAHRLSHANTAAR